MCSHYEATTDPERYHWHFGVNPPAEADKHDLWPGYAGSFIRRPRSEDHGGKPPEMEAMSGVFGLIPHWAKDATMTRRTYNARSETVAEKPSYRDAWQLGGAASSRPMPSTSPTGAAGRPFRRASLVPTVIPWD